MPLTRAVALLIQLDIIGSGPEFCAELNVGKRNAQRPHARCPGRLWLRPPLFSVPLQGILAIGSTPVGPGSGTRRGTGLAHAGQVTRESLWILTSSSWRSRNCARSLRASIFCHAWKGAVFLISAGSHADPAALSLGWEWAAVAISAGHLVSDLSQRRVVRKGSAQLARVL